MCTLPTPLLPPTGRVRKTHRRSCMRNSHHNCTTQLADQTPRPSRRAQTHAAAARFTATAQLGALRTEPPPGNRIHTPPRQLRTSKPGLLLPAA